MSNTKINGVLGEKTFHAWLVNPNLKSDAVLIQTY